ncbi:MAG: Abi family protein [Planctomycetota bacterium]|nr:MAG: Abi family protein [Planctomycetota bacterium]
MDLLSVKTPEPYSKPWLPVEKQVEHLESRGLIVPDRKSAVSFLKHVNYYRLSGYCLAFQNAAFRYDRVSFPMIQDAYRFDVALRDFLTEALEVIEIDVRANVALIFGERYGAFGHTNRLNFRKTFRFDDWTLKIQEEADRSKELFVTHFRDRYQGFPNLPCWVVTEIMSFGSLSRMYDGMLDQCQSPISSRYALQKSDLASILHHLSYVRNVCAHHCRVWDRQWDITPILPHNQNWKSPFILGGDRVFVTLLLIYRILQRCPLQDPFAREWRKRVNELLRVPPSAPDALGKMGMPANWYNHPYWK